MAGFLKDCRRKALEILHKSFFKKHLACNMVNISNFSPVPFVPTSWFLVDMFVFDNLLDQVVEGLYSGVAQ